MILHLEIRTVEMLNLDDGGKLLQLAMVDASNPPSLRSDATFKTYLSPKKRSSLADGPLEDTQVTMLARTVGPAKGGGIKLGGEIVSGIQTIADMGKKFGGSATDFSDSDMLKAGQDVPYKPTDDSKPVAQPSPKSKEASAKS